MFKFTQSGILAESDLSEVWWENEEIVYCKMLRTDARLIQDEYLLAVPASERPDSETIRRLTHEFELREYLDVPWAVRPLELVQMPGQTILLLERPSGEPLHHQVGAPMSIGRFLEIALALTKVVRQLHYSGLLHKDIKPSHFLLDNVTGNIKLTGFGIASRPLRGLPSPDTLNIMSGTLPYMAPEQTGRISGSIDSRTDLYSLGVTFYQILTGRLPFAASEPMEWVHCHIARLPTPPHEVYDAVPHAVSAIILKLLAKAPEERYQTAIGLENDLSKCLIDWQRHRRIEDFEIGESDIGDRLVIPDKLYGRALESASLLAAFERVAKTGRSELLLIRGHAGIGKSALVREMHKGLARSGCLFAAGKFDQYKRDIPYSTVAQAFQHLVRQLLNKPEAELSLWRRELTESLGLNGQLMVNLVPQLAVVIGEQPPVPRVDAKDSQARFHQVFRSFLGVFARKEHPLVLFLDDLQWIDVATLDLMKDLVTDSRTQHLLLIGAYRDNEVGNAHPLNDMLKTIRDEGASTSELLLSPLHVDQVSQFAADALHTDTERAGQLAALVSEKTGGNPFFAIQFISELAEERLLTFDFSSSAWQWDLNRIQSKNISDNIADLMAAKLNRLPDDTRDALGQLACLGNAADLRTLMAIRDASEEQLGDSLRGAIDSGLITRNGDSFAFIHDRVHEAAYAMIPGSDRASVHLDVARAILSKTKPAELEDRIFEIVDQFNRGRIEIRTPAERLQVAELNLIAGRRARTSSAYLSAQRYLDFGIELLPTDSWQSAYRLTFDLERYRAECDFVAGDLRAADERLAALKKRTTTIADETEVVCLQLLVHFTAGRQNLAIELGLAFLEHTGSVLSPDPRDEDVRCEYEKVLSNIENVRIEELLHLPKMTDPNHLATMQVLTELYPAASTSENSSKALADLIILRMTNLSLEQGNCDASSVAYSGLSLFLAPRFDDHLTAYRFGKLACDLADRDGTDRSKARAYAQSGSFAMPWFREFRECRSLLALAFDELKLAGDTVFAAYTLRNSVTNSLVSGVPLDQVQQEAEEAFDFACAAGIGPVAAPLVGQRTLVAALRGIELGDESPGEDWARREVGEQRGFGKFASYYWVFKLQAKYFASDYSAALEAASFVEPIRWAMMAGLEELVYDFYAGLSHAAICRNVVAPRREEHLCALRVHARRIEKWSDQCPENFANCKSLLLAEIARVEGFYTDAEHLYEEAIDLAVRHGFLQNEGLASELAAHFYRERGLERIAITYARNARSCYVRWGAVVKVRQLDQLYPHLGNEKQGSHSSSAMLTSVEHLDLATVIKVSQAVSSEIVLENLITTLMRLAVEYAGAERGLLILPDDDAYRIEAEAATHKDGVTVSLRQTSVSAKELPESVFQYVVRTKETVLLHDASAEISFVSDEYILLNRGRSILCMPLLKQGRLLGVLYLENNLAHQVFTPDRISILKLLASAATISLENTRLYADLQEREARVRRLVDSNIIGIFIWDADGCIIEANDAFLRIVGHSRSDFTSGRIRWRDLTPVEWTIADEQRLANIGDTGVAAPYEKEFFRKDGTRVPVLIGGAVFDGVPSQGVAFVLDLTDRYNAEHAARDSKRRYHELELQLIRANRVATIGQLSASIAHELNQPLTGITTNANTCLSMLAASAPNIAGAADTARRTIRDAKRATDVIARLRSLFANDDSRSELLDLSEVTQEVLDLCSSEFRRTNVNIERALPADLPRIKGDRVQLQQVILNLLQNAIDSVNSVPGGPRRLAIRIESDDRNLVVLGVRDTGTGFDARNAHKLFDAFYTTKNEGMGIGLSVSRSIIDGHSGRIWAANNVGPGATVSFSLQGYVMN